jgi:hypothetical protein
VHARAQWTRNASCRECWNRPAEAPSLTAQSSRLRCPLSLPQISLATFELLIGAVSAGASMDGLRYVGLVLTLLFPARDSVITVRLEAVGRRRSRIRKGYARVRVPLRRAPRTHIGSERCLCQKAGEPKSSAQQYGKQHLSLSAAVGRGQVHAALWNQRGCRRSRHASTSGCLRSIRGTRRGTTMPAGGSNIDCPVTARQSYDARNLRARLRWRCRQDVSWTLP